MGVVHRGIPKDLIIKIISQVKPTCFIETGTFRGETALWASDYFKKIYTIELDPELSADASIIFSGKENIELLTGNSIQKLSGIIDRLSPHSIFWLDAHYSADQTAGKESECPVIEEIEVISSKKNLDPILLIDDARFFMGPPPAPFHDASHWPRIDELFFHLKKCFENNFITIIDDVIVCAPESARKAIDLYWQETFFQRFGENKKSFFKKIFQL
jgi:hypothetical protein